MTYGLYVSAAGAQAQNHRLQVLSSNLANVQTAGYKPQQAVMQARFAELIERGEASPGTGGVDDVGGGVTVQPTVTQYDQGVLRKTGNLTDLAINDNESFFVIQRDGKQMLTRAGDFLFDSAGRLVNQRGDQVLDTEGRQITIDPTLPHSIQDGGRIQQGEEIFNVMLARPKNLDQLRHLGGNLFEAPQDLDLVRGNSRPVVSGFLEQSGVQPTGAMMELIEASRAYEANARMIQNHDTVVGSLISRVLQK
jgi:flagellar basal body rod protein FlgG